MFVTLLQVPSFCLLASLLAQVDSWFLSDLTQLEGRLEANYKDSDCSAVTDVEVWQQTLRWANRR